MEEMDSFLEPLSADTLLPAVPWKLLVVITLLAGDDSDPPRGLPGALITPAPPAAAVPAFSTAAAASNHPPPPPAAVEEIESLGPSPRLLGLLLCVLLSVQSPLTRRRPLLAAPDERRPRSARSKGLPVSVAPTFGDVESGEEDCGGEGEGLLRAEAALDLAADPRMPAAPKRSPVTACARDAAAEPRMVAPPAGSSPSTFAKGFGDDDRGDPSDRSA